MVPLRLAAACLIALALVTGAGAASASAKAKAPTGLHGFLLRADEPRTTSFTRTPAFAWNPFPGAVSYEFELSTSNVFRDNGIIWKCPNANCSLTTPVAAPYLSLPWITGSPHGLYARVRAVLAGGGKTHWSKPYGFDIVPPAPPTPLAAAPGLIRWTPVPGANGYQVWLIDANKVEQVYTNVLDERDFYTFHQSSAWIGTVRWRIRALRVDWNVDERLNGVPVTKYGAWSPIYKSTNPNVASGPIHLGSTISDVVTNGKRSDPAHRLMPAFTWSGNQAADGTRAELFRVYVFTDRACLNRVYTSSVVGGSAYAPRPYGGLNLPTTATGVTAARGAYLDDSRSSAPPSMTYDGEKISSSEIAKAATPTTTLPAAAGASGSGGGSQGQSSAEIKVGAGDDYGAPVSLWDDQWPQGGYYWTVVPVQAQFVGSIGTTLAGAAAKGSTTVVLTSDPGFGVGDKVQVGAGTDVEVLTITAVSGNNITFSSPAISDHGAGEPVVRLGGTITYRDLELAQDVCAAGRVGRFGVDSEPSLVAGNDPFVSGISSTGGLASAVTKGTFYKSPLIAWTPALGAWAYEVQWSKSASPFVPEPAPGGGEGVLLGSTAYVLPLDPGTWYYRVRGFDWSLETGAQEMGWSDVAKIVITRPTYSVVPSSTKKTASKK